MANLILTEEGWQERIRDKLGVDEAYLPNSVIEQPDVIEVGESNIITRVPQYESLVGAESAWLKAAAVCECAALLCPTIKTRLPSRERGPHFEQELSVDWGVRRSELEDERDNFIVLISGAASCPHFGLSR